jgi:thiosulfate reductase cytochrome b subunit
MSVSSFWTFAIFMFVLSTLAITRLWVPQRWRGRERRYIALTAGTGAVFLAAAVLGWSGWLVTLMGAGMLVLSVIAVTRIWTPSLLRGFALPFGVLTAGSAVMFIPGGVYLQTNDEMHGAVPILLLTGLAVFVAGVVFVGRRERRLRRENGTGPLQ